MDNPFLKQLQSKLQSSLSATREAASTAANGATSSNGVANVDALAARSGKDKEHSLSISDKKANVHFDEEQDAKKVLRDMIVVVVVLLFCLLIYSLKIILISTLWFV